MEAVQAKGRGCIKISAKAWPYLGSIETPEQCHKALMLPDTYEVERIDHRDNLDVFEVWVLSDAIPVGDAHISQTEVIPYYSKIDGKAVLARIEIKQWNGICWVEVSK